MEIVRNGREQVKESVGDCQEELHSVDIIGKVYGRQPSQSQRGVKKDVLDGCVNNQEKVKDPKDRRNRGKQLTYGKDYKNDNQQKKNNPQHQKLERNYGYG